jgi:hypothetical protein
MVRLAPKDLCQDDLRPQKFKMPLYTLLFIVNRIPCSALRTKDQDSRAAGLLPTRGRTKQPRLEGLSAAEVFFFPGKPPLASLPMP